MIDEAAQKTEPEDASSLTGELSVTNVILNDDQDTAVIDGASRWTIFWYLVLPLARPAIAVTALFSFMTAWNEFILAATLLGDASLFTLPVALQQHVGEFQTEYKEYFEGEYNTFLPEEGKIGSINSPLLIFLHGYYPEYNPPEFM